MRDLTGLLCCTNAVVESSCGGSDWSGLPPVFQAPGACAEANGPEAEEMEALVRLRPLPILRDRRQWIGSRRPALNCCCRGKVAKPRRSLGAGTATCTPPPGSSCGSWRDEVVEIARLGPLISEIGCGGRRGSGGALVAIPAAAAARKPSDVRATAQPFSEKTPSLSARVAAGIAGVRENKEKPLLGEARALLRRDENAEPVAKGHQDEYKTCRSMEATYIIHA